MVKTAAEGRVMLEALEAGTAGVVLRTEDPLQVQGLCWQHQCYSTGADDLSECMDTCAVVLYMTPGCCCVTSCFSTHAKLGTLAENLAVHGCVTVVQTGLVKYRPGLRVPQLFLPERHCHTYASSCVTIHLQTVSVLLHV